ncbi:TPA: putative baseplate assembly protein, partial [Methanosarcinaceae archaeon]|nr:putative baseplate assembly protein [Methanosarcinaceae archaeon]
ALYDTFYMACSEVFSRQGCEVRLDFDLLPGKTGPGLPPEKPVLSWEYWNGESWRNLKKFMDFSMDLGEGKEGKSWEGKGREGKGGEGEKFPEVEPENFPAKETTEKEAEKESYEVTRFFHAKDKEDRKEKDEIALFVQASAKIREMPPMVPGNVNGTENYWVRVRLIEGNFGKEYVISKKNKIEPGKFHPPEIRNLKLSYIDREGRKPGDLVSENNRVFENKGKEMKLAGSFRPFEGVFEPLPAVYFGFTSKLVKGPLSLFAKLEETFVDEGPPVKFRWQYLPAGNGSSEEGERKWKWKDLEGLDETGGLAKSGVLEFFVPGEMKALQLFGSKSPLYWVRILFIKGKRTPRISGLYPNCVWAVQARTVEEEMLGSGSGEAGQVFMLMNRPVVDASARANEAAWLPEGEKQALLKERARDVEAIKDDNGRFSEFWVRWEEVPDFSGSEGKSRHYLLDRTSGEIRFGDGTRGMILPLGANNVKASYRTGGGEAGNLEAYSITKLYSALKYIDEVYNPGASDGGSETESVNELLERAPATFRHRGRGVSANDIMQLAREATGKVAKVRVLSGSDEEGNRVPRLVTAVIVPELPGPRPAPTGELIRMVESYLKARASSTGKLKVAGPIYCRVDVNAELFTADPGAVHEVENRVKARVEEFLHPLRGGKEGNGWGFGQVPSASDFYSHLGDCKGVSYVKGIDIELRKENGTPGKLTGNSCISRHSDLPALPESALPCSGKHEINVLWKAERGE